MARTGKDFVWALEELRSGERVQRTGWNGKGMFVTLQLGYPNGIPINANTADAIHEREGSVHRFAPYFLLKEAGGSFVPWTAATADILAEDWQKFAGAVSPVDSRDRKMLDEDEARHEKVLVEDDRRGEDAPTPLEQAGIDYAKDHDGGES